MKLYFCDRCHQSIPHGHARTGRKGKTFCNRCVRKTTTLWRVGVVTMLLGAAVAGVWLRQDAARRDDQLRREFSREMMALEGRVGFCLFMLQQSQRQLENDVIYTLQVHRQAYEDTIRSMREAFKKLREDLADEIVTGSKELKEVNDELVQRVVTLEQQTKQLSEDLAELAQIPADVMEPMLQSVVGIVVKTKDKSHDQGSGVLYSKVKVGEEWVYTGFTAYHVVHEYLKVVDKEKNSKTMKEEQKKHPVLQAHIYGNVNLGFPTIRVDVTLPETRHRGWVGGNPYDPFQNLKSNQDYITFSFKSKRDLPVAELATDEEIKRLKPGAAVLGIGIHPTKRPAVYLGSIASLTSNADGNMAFQTMAWPGMSGSPIFDRKTKKVIAIVQKMAVSMFSANCTVAYGQPLSKLDARFRKH